MHLDRFDPGRTNAELSTHHGGTLADELAALLSLALGRRFMAGSESRDFEPGGDTLGRPLLVFGYESVTLPVSSPLQGRVLPGAGDDVHLDAQLTHFQRLPDLFPRTAAALVQSARLYQEAIWIARNGCSSPLGSCLCRLWRLRPVNGAASGVVQRSAFVLRNLIWQPSWKQSEEAVWSSWWQMKWENSSEQPSPSWSSWRTMLRPHRQSGPSDSRKSIGTVCQQHFGRSTGTVRLIFIVVSHSLHPFVRIRSREVSEWRTRDRRVLPQGRASTCGKPRSFQCTSTCSSTSLAEPLGLGGNLWLSRQSSSEDV